MLEVKAMGLNFKNPIIVSAGPWTRGHKNIREAFKSGAAAVVTESIVSEPSPDVSPRYAYDGRGVQNIRMYSGLNMDAWLQELEILHREERDGLLIASVMASTPSELSYLARKLEASGVDALELGIACPMGEGLEIIAGNADKAYSFTKAAVEVVDIPVIVKLTQSVNNLSEVVSAIKEAGGSGISAIDTMRCILNVDIEAGKPTLPTYGGYSGAPVRPMGLATVAGIAQCSDLPVIGIGGIESYENAVEYMMLGASVCGIGTSVMLEGYEVIGRIITDLQGYMQRHGFSRLEDIRGRGLEELHSFEEIRIEPNIAHMLSECTKDACAKCLRCCLDNAIKIEDGKIVINEEICTGCALCVDVCPDSKIGFCKFFA